jgi:hypothetical protein
MAEINIQRKKKTVSPWLLILLVLLLLGLGIWYLVRRDPGAPPANTAAVEAPTAPAPAPTVTPGAPTSPAANENPNPTSTGDPSIGALVNEGNAADVEVMEPADFYAFVADDPAGSNYAQRGLMMLRNVLVDMSDRADLRGGAVAERRNDLTSATSRLSAGGSMRAGFVAAAQLMQEMQQQGYPSIEREAKGLVDKAGQISGRTTSEAEQQATQQFFQQAANVLRVLEKPASGR